MDKGRYLVIITILDQITTRACPSESLNNLQCCVSLSNRGQAQDTSHRPVSGMSRRGVGERRRFAGAALRVGAVWELAAWDNFNLSARY